ncbi:MAG: hypothetical protein ALECFALPRED_004739 [Alectoria fallacina]|uniref:PNPLA domain-containing protein n=1 Tax=Alectoria fallacina TaxID=1903189 RepID=A0A8H3FX44_9LECA|nr:MAG: hypothetical protein ALECFALPRED_004739 [Alectoria fallacina]
MLGRLQMDIQPCIEAYSELSRGIFRERGLPVDWQGHVKGKYKTSELEDAVKKIVKDSGSPEDAPLDDGKDRGCRVFVCAVRKENKAVARLRAYHSDTALVEDGATIWEAARATSAASGFFDPISIGQHGQEYVDAGLGRNNPVDEVWTEAQDIWSPEGNDLAALVKCFISIGTGNPGTSPIEDGALKIFTKTLKDIATETEKTAEIFARSRRGLLTQQRYFRFNVDQGLQNVGLEEYKKEKDIVSATSLYMESQHMQSQMRDCSKAMKDKEFWKGDLKEMVEPILREHPQERERFHLVLSLATAPEIDYFVGRASNLASIESLLLPFTAAERKIVFLHGLGGIGKSQLAIEFAKKHRRDYTAVLWLNAKTEDTLKRSFAANARRLLKECFNQDLLDGPQDEKALSAILREMKTWLNLPGNDRWLLIYDNLDNPKIPDNKRQHAYDIRSYFPEAHQGSILVTTRWKTLRIGHPLEITKLSNDEESLSLLVRMSGRAIGEDLRIKDLLRKLDGLPLALATAGAFLGLNDMSVSDYLHHHETSWLDLQRKCLPLLSYEDQTIYSTWNLSYIYIRKEDMSAAKLLELWAYFDNRDLWYDLLKAGEDWAPDWFLKIVSDKFAFHTAMGKLRKHALIESLTASNGYSMHNCVHAWLRSVLCTPIELKNIKLALNCVQTSLPINSVPDAWIIVQRLSPHFERCLQLLLEWNDKNKDCKRTEILVARTTRILGILYNDQGKLMEAEPMLQRALAITENTLGPDHKNTLSLVGILGGLYCDVGELTKAESMLQRALIGFEKKTDQETSATLAVIDTLGRLYRIQGRLTDAELMYQRALTGTERMLRRNDARTLSTVNNLGILYDNQGKLTEAESMYQRALAGFETAFGWDHAHKLNTVHNLALIYRQQGKLNEAESMCQRALIGKEKIFGQDHIKTLDTIHNLGLVYLDQGKLMQAESMFQRVLLGFIKNPPPNPKDHLDLFYNMGLLSRELQDFERARGFFKQAYEGYQELFGSQHGATIAALDQLNIEIERSTQGAESSGGQGDPTETETD